ncbi:MAG: helix-turn-helix domain-containing protein [Microcystaceae cyanobacterium]
MNHQLSPLDRTPLLESDNYEEAEMMLIQLIGPCKSDFLEPHSVFLTRYYYAPFHQSSMVYLQWRGAQKLIREQPDDLYVFYLPIEGCIKEEINQLEPILSSEKVAHVFTPQQNLVGEIGSQGQGISVCISRQKLQQEMAKLLNSSVNSLITFQPEVDLTTAFGHSLKELILFSWQATAQNSLFLPQLEQTLLTGLLQYHSHNYSAALQRKEGIVGDRQVYLAQEFMRANLQKPLSLGDIASAIGVSGRSLQRSFARYCGCSPIQFLRQARLDILHQELSKGMPLLGITDLMIKYQFSHFGRCSQSYHQRFGELPSETVRRSPQSLIF